MKRRRNNKLTDLIESLQIKIVSRSFNWKKEYYNSKKKKYKL
jgi:hypothetical protein